MSARSRRTRSSTTASSPPENAQATAELQLLLDNLRETLQEPTSNSYPDLGTVTAQCQSIRQYLIAAPGASKISDSFRHLHSFELLLDTLRTFSGFYHPTKRSQSDKLQIFGLVEAILGILAQTCREHYGNRRYFKRRVEGGGWAALEQTIASIGIGGSESDAWSEAQLFGRLLSFALDDKRLQDLCLKVVEETPPFSTSSPSNTSKQIPSSSVGIASKDIDARDKDILAFVETRLQEILQESALIHNADIIPTIIDFWRTMPRKKDTSTNPAALVVILTLMRISSISIHNLMALHATGILSTLLSLTFDSESPLGPSEKASIEVLCGSLISVGVNTLNDAQSLLCNKSPAAAEFLLRAIKKSQSPAYIQFDLSLHGYASIELPNLGRQFPPPSTSAGYSFTAWIYIDQFDPRCHTTIFGAFDDSQTCFVLGYLEKDSHCFILQTSMSSTRPSVRFKSVVFEEDKWYHIAVVHRRPKTMSSSRAFLYVNGEFAEQTTKCPYPSQPALSAASADSFTSFTSSSAKLNPVQAFIGTPHDLSSKLGPQVQFSRWSLASAHLFEDVISDDLIAVYYQLGPRYNGNFQDVLGSFQTYAASAALSMRNELLHPGKDDSSDLSTAIRQRASTIMPESRIIFSILPTAVLRDDDRYNKHESQLLRGLNQTAANHLYQLTHNNGTAVAINASIPSINDALVRSHGTTILAGDPVVVVPQSLDAVMWRLGGFTGIALKLVENANTKDEIVRAVEILFESIKGSWRNSEAIERENGFSILGALLRGKLGAGVVVASKSGPEPSAMTNEDRDQLGLQLLSRVLDFVGYNFEKPDESFIINPLAYRILLIDFDMWRKTALITQQLYYRQFFVFGVKSKFFKFNRVRLLRMRMSKSPFPPSTDTF